MGNTTWVQVWQRMWERGAPARRVAWAAVTLLFTMAIMAAALAPTRLDLAVGQAAPRDIVAPRDGVDSAATYAAQLAAEAKVNPVFDRDTAAITAAIGRVGQAFAYVSADQAVRGQTIEQQATTLVGQLSTLAPSQTWSTGLLGTILELPAATLSVLQTHTTQIVSSVMELGIQPQALSTFRDRATEEGLGLSLPRSQALFVAQLAAGLLVPSLVYDAAASLAARQQAVDSVAPVRVFRGQLLIPAGQVLTAHDLALLRDLGLVPSVAYDRSLLGAAVWGALLWALLATWVTRPGSRLAQRESRLMVMAVVWLGGLALLVLASRTEPLLAPVAAAALLAGSLLGPGVGLVFAAALLVALLLVAGGGTTVLLAGGAVVAAALASPDDAPGNLPRLGAWVLAANVASVTASLLINGASSSGLVATELGQAVVNGFLSLLLAMGTFPLLEGYTRRVSSAQLQALASPDQPLLRRLLLEAPGTYHHSLLVANLVEGAVRGIGGDAVLARVGAYYHDVGKLERPYLFIENQVGRDNPHQQLPPAVSASLVIAHVRDGVRLARAAGVPEAVVAFIQQHHGTMTTSYFLQQARTAKPDVDDAGFRYPGPVPQSREVAVCMLADSCEAAVRALPEATPAQVEATVKKLIRLRLMDGQLDGGDLTLKDLQTVAAIFSQVLVGMFHPRIEYPDAATAPGQGRPLS